MAVVTVVNRKELSEKEVLPVGTVVHTVFYNIFSGSLAEATHTLTMTRETPGVELNVLLRKIADSAELSVLGFSLEQEGSVVNRNLLVINDELVIINKFNSTEELFVPVKANAILTVDMVKEVL